MEALLVVLVCISLRKLDFYHPFTFNTANNFNIEKILSATLCVPLSLRDKKLHPILFSYPFQLSLGDVLKQEFQPK